MQHVCQFLVSMSCLCLDGGLAGGRLEGLSVGGRHWLPVWLLLEVGSEVRTKLRCPEKREKRSMAAYADRLHLICCVFIPGLKGVSLLHVEDQKSEEKFTFTHKSADQEIGGCQLVFGRRRRRWLEIYMESNPGWICTGFPYCTGDAQETCKNCLLPLLPGF